mgnify:CR=1 FL=1
MKRILLAAWLTALLPLAIHADTAQRIDSAQASFMLEEVIEGRTSGAIDGLTVFKLYDTFGFLKDLTADIDR